MDGLLIRSPAEDREMKSALRRLIHRPDLSTTQESHQVHVLSRYLEKRGLTFEHCLMTTGPSGPSTCCLCVDVPGRTATLFLPALIHADQGEAIVSLLRETADRAARRGVQVLQGMVAVDDRFQANLLSRAGFERLTELIYLEADLSGPLLVGKNPRPLSFETYTTENHHLFAATVLGSYDGSLDCGHLNGRREIEDILATHRATGVFEATNWMLARSGSHVVGVLLLAGIPETGSCEIVYVGLLRPYRRQGLGASLVYRSVELARRKAATRLTLAVDAQNEPARQLYARFGFVENARRDAWIRFLKHP